MSICAAALVLLLQSDPKDRLFEAIKESNVEAAQKALADLVQGDGVRAARAVMASLPRARERLNVLIAVTQRARENYMTVDTSFGTAYSVDQFPIFNAYLHANFQPVAVVDGAILYQRRDDAR